MVDLLVVGPTKMFCLKANILYFLNQSLYHSTWCTILLNGKGSSNWLWSRVQYCVFFKRGQSTIF